MKFVPTVAAGLALTAQVVSAADAPKVRVELYFEAQCPSCQDFTTGPLADVLSKPDMVEIIDLQLVPYGNTKKNADGSFTCQHGTGECTSDVYEMCAEYLLSGDVNSIVTGATSLAAWPFIYCMEEAEGNPLKGESCWTSTMNSSSVSWSDIQKCSSNEASDVQNAGATATPTHDYVPWPLVDGVLLEQTRLLQHSICQAYTGTKPASCTVGRVIPEGACINK